MPPTGTKSSAGARSYGGAPRGAAGEAAGAIWEHKQLETETGLRMTL